MSCGCLNRELLLAANTKYATQEERDSARRERHRLWSAKQRRFTRKTRRLVGAASVRYYTAAHALNLAVRRINTSLEPIDQGPDAPPLCTCHHEPMRSNASSWRCAVKRREYERQTNSYDPVKSSKQKRRRRAAKRGVLSEPYSRQEVFDRDGGKCRYCEGAVGSDWHIAHLVALSRGGADTLDNVAVSCRSCNLADGVGRLPVQLHLPRAA